MRRELWIALAAAGAIALSGCAHNVGKGSAAGQAAGPAAPTSSTATEGYAGAGVSGQTLPSNGPIGGKSSGLTAAEMAAMPKHLRVHFTFNSSSLDGEAQQIAGTNAEFMLAHPHVKVRLEGNTDERGTQEYNLGLGERRSEAVKQYLEAQGVASARISTVSFGKDNPLCTESTESCFAKDRRVDFVYSGGYQGAAGAATPNPGNPASYAGYSGGQ